MATFPGKGRFGESSEDNINEYRNKSKNENTEKSTLVWVNVWNKWCEEKQIQVKMEDEEPENLNKKLEKFYAEIKAKDGSDYEPDSLRVMMSALDRHLKEKGYKYSIIKDRQFTSSKQVIEGKARQLRQEGKGKRPNKARSLTKEEEEVLWKDEKFGPKTPESLRNTVWWLLTQFFGLRGRQEHHNMRMEDLHILTADDGVEFVEYNEGLTKTRQGGLHVKQRDFKPRMFAIGGERCPVALYKEYVARRPAHLRTTGPFYLSIKSNRRAHDDTWYKVQPMGINKLNDMMKGIVDGTSLAEKEKRFTNHSARKTVVSKLKNQVERSSIVKVTGHRNLQSVDDYDEADEEEQRQLSLVISSRNYTDQPQPKQVNTSLSLPRGQQSSSTLSEIPRQRVNIQGQNYQQDVGNTCTLSQLSAMACQKQNMVNSFNNCQVSFNFTTKTSPLISPSSPKKTKRRHHVLDSDSD